MIVRRCANCELRKWTCPCPPPDIKSPWGYAEYVQLGNYWLHMSTVDQLRPSYGSALAAYDKAIRLAGTTDETKAARDGYLFAWRGVSAQTRDGRAHMNAAPVDGCGCPVCVDATDQPIIRLVSVEH